MEKYIHKVNYYKTSTTFGDSVEIDVAVESFKGVKLTISYTMTKVGTTELVATGKTRHCFVNEEGRPVILKKTFPALDEKLREMVKGE